MYGELSQRVRMEAFNNYYDTIIKKQTLRKNGWKSLETHL